MRIQSKNNILLADVCFFIFLFTEIIFTHTLVGQMGLLLFIFSIILMMIQKKKLYLNYYIIIMIIFIFYSYYNILRGNVINQTTAMSMIDTLIKNTIFAVFFCNYLYLRRNQVVVIKIFIISCVIISIFTIIVTLPNTLSFFINHINISFNILNISILINPNTIGLISAFSCALLLYFILKNHKSYILILLFLAFVAMISGSRKVIIILFTIPIIYLYWIYPNYRFRNILLILFFLMMTLIFIYNMPILYNTIGYRIDAIINFAKGFEGDGSLQQRDRFIEVGWDNFIKKPLVGYGLDCYRYLPYSYGKYSHNNFIEILISGGVIGFCIYYSIHIMTIIKCITNKVFSDNLTKLMFIIFIVMLALDYAMVSYFNRINLIILLMVISQITFIIDSNKKRGLI